jgi:hypothetical protein
MKPEYRIELRVYDNESGETLAREDTYLGDLDLSNSPFEMAEVCLGRLERRFPKTHAQHLAEYYPESDDDEE